MTSPDQIQHFLFSELDVRGQMVGLQDCYRQVLEHYQYPARMQTLLGEFLAAAALLTSTIKIDGRLSIQAQGDGDLSMIMAECNSALEVRAIARWQGDLTETSLQKLLGEGRLVITIDPNKGQRYQGVVPFSGDSLAACLESYFDQSEQLKTKIWLYAEPGKQASGLLLQSMPPSQPTPDADGWNRICQLTHTLTPQELSELQNVSLIYRLYHEEEVNLYPPAPVSFRCSCSKERTLAALVSLGQEEIEDIFKESELLEVRCEFCGQAYSFTADEIDPYLLEQDICVSAQDLDPDRTLH